MGLIFNGNGDVIKAVDGSLTVEGLDLDSSSTNINAGIVTGTSANFTGNVSVGGVLTYEDVKNVDSVGIVTARAGIVAQDDVTFTGATSGRDIVWDKSADELKVKDNTKISFGTDRDLQLSHNNSDSVISHIGSATGNLKILSGGAQSIECVKAGAVNIAHNGTTKLQTSSSGVDITGDVTMTNTSSNPQLALISANNGISEIQFGDGADAVRGNIIYRAGSAGDALCFNGYNNTERMRIDSSGRLLVGTTAGWGSDVKLHLANSGNTYLTLTSGTSHNSVLAFSDDGSERGAIDYDHNGDHMLFKTAAAERLRITSAGKVVIGDTNSDSLFGVYRASHQVAEFTNTNADATGAELTLRKDSSSPADGDSLGLINFTGDNDAGEKVLYSYIQSKSVDVSDGTEDGSLYFYTRGAGTLAERVRIKSDGSMSLGAVDPARVPLHIHQPTSASAYLHMTNSGTGSGSTDGFSLYVATDGSVHYRARESSADCLFYTESTERLRITANGDIGINQSSPRTISGYKGITINHATHGGFIQFQDDGTNTSSVLGGANSLNLSTQTSIPILFYTAGTERLRIDANGKVIVAGGQVHASRVLARFGIDCHGMDIYDGVGTVANYGMAFYNDPTTNKANGIGFFNDDGQTCGGYIVHQDKGGSNIGDLIFATAAVANTPVERLRLTSGGQLIQYTTHTTGNSAHGNTSWYGDDASQYTIEIRDFNEMYAVKTVNSNSYDSIIYKREKMTNYCDIEFTMTSASDNSSGSFMHLGMVINGDGSDTHSNFDRLVFRSHGGSTSSNHIRIDKGGGGTGFTYQTSNLPVFFDGNERHYQIKIRGRRFSIYIDGSHVVTRYTDANLVRTHGFFGFNIYEASTVNPYIKIRDFKITNHTPNTGVPGWEVVFDTPASTNASSSFVIDNMDNPQTVEMRYWRLRHSGGNTNTYMRLGWQGSWKTSGYYDIGQYHNESGNWNASRGHNQGQACPFHYDFTGSTNYYSGCITIRRVTSGGNNTGFIYKCEHVVDYDSGSTQYHVLVNGQVNFGNTNPWTKIQLYTNSGTNFNYGSMQVLAQY